jgi:hypothetical protein
MNDRMKEVEEAQATIQEDTDFLLKEMVEGAQGYVLLMVDSEGLVTPRVHGLNEIETLGTMEAAKHLIMADFLGLVSDSDEDEDVEVDFEGKKDEAGAN